MYDFQIEGKKVLEVGCGLGLVSLVLNQRMANITCTDYHPEAEKYLQLNTKLNSERIIPFFLADWKNKNDDREKFDLILGSDLLYEASHSTILSEFLERHATENCEIIIVDPGRKHINQFTSKMKTLTYTYTQEKPRDQSYLDLPFKGSINRYIKKKLI